MIEALAHERRVDCYALAVGKRAVAINQREGRGRIEGRHATLEELGRPDVVGAEGGETLARRIPCAVFTPGRRPAVGLFEQPNAVAEPLHDCESIVARAVVDANYLEILERLRDDA